MALARKRLAFSTLKLVLRSSLLIVAHVLHALRVGYAQVCSLARERLTFTSSLIPATALRSSSLLLATALCTLIVHSSSLIDSLILSSIVRSSTLELENVLRTSLLVHAHARERLACVLRSSTLPLRSLARERLALIVALACNSPELTHRPSSSLMPMKHRALISMLMLENVLRSYRRTIVAHACNSPSLTVHHDGSRSQASCVLHAQARERLAFVALSSRCSSLLMCYM